MLLRVCMYTLHNGGNELNLQYCANFVERTNECVYTVHMENIRNSKVGMQKKFLIDFRARRAVNAKVCSNLKFISAWKIRVL